jgi:hypothetical protein
MKKKKWPSIKGRVPQIRSLLAKSPSTAREIAAILKIPVRGAQLGIWILTSTNQAHSRTTIPSIEIEGRENLKLYELTPKGMRNHKKLKGK